MKLLAKLLNTILDIGKISSDWKSALKIPFLKKGDHRDIIIIEELDCYRAYVKFWNRF